MVLATRNQLPLEFRIALSVPAWRQLLSRQLAEVVIAILGEVTVARRRRVLQPQPAIELALADMAHDGPDLVSGLQPLATRTHLYRRWGADERSARLLALDRDDAGHRIPTRPRVHGGRVVSGVDSEEMHAHMSRP